MRIPSTPVTVSCCSVIGPSCRSIPNKSRCGGHSASFNRLGACADDRRIVKYDLRGGWFSARDVYVDARRPSLDGAPFAPAAGARAAARHLAVVALITPGTGPRRRRPRRRHRRRVSCPCGRARRLRSDSRLGLAQA